MRFCARCLYPVTHPLYLTLDEQGICSGCRIHEEKDRLDWAKRFERLRSLLDQYRNHSGNNYDCVIPVSGARDSFFIVHTVKNVLGMNPLLVTYNKHYNTDVGVRNLARLRIAFNCDIMTLTVNPETVKKITRATFRRFGNVYWHCLAGQTVYPVQIATKFKIPLIIWGAHQGIDQVGMFSHLDEVEMTRKYRKEHDLFGIEADDLINSADGIKETDIHPYRYPDNREIERIGVRGIYLNNFIRWDSRTQHEAMIEQYGYESRQQQRTFDYYHDADCWVYSDVHDYLKYLKHGYGKVLDHACREIRLRRMTRECGLALVKEYTQQPLHYLDKFLAWLGITENAFHYIADQHRNESLWFRNQRWEWVPKLDLIALMENPCLKGVELAPCFAHQFYQVTPVALSTDSKNSYILIGKGYA
jgi:N-acetyl sugar amidotransferase